jgi:hypothetical protein
VQGWQVLCGDERMAQDCEDDDAWHFVNSREPSVLASYPTSDKPVEVYWRILLADPYSNKGDALERISDHSELRELMLTVSSVPETR